MEESLTLILHTISAQLLSVFSDQRNLEMVTWKKFCVASRKESLTQELD